jgi:hypothetical protein
MKQHKMYVPKKILSTLMKRSKHRELMARFRMRIFTAPTPIFTHTSMEIEGMRPYIVISKGRYENN